jgi:hypothetical protein
VTTLYYNKVGRLLRVDLPRELWIVQAGVFLNYLGWGCVMPFEVIYLHAGRGFSLGVAGLVVGSSRASPSWPPPSPVR